MNWTTIIAQLRNGPIHIGNLTISLEYRNCGKCTRCPHGPYVYLRDRSGKRHYLGSTRALLNAEPHTLAKLQSIPIPGLDPP